MCTYTAAFKYPNSEHIYIAINCQAFYKFICGFIVAVQECYWETTFFMKGSSQDFYKQSGLLIIFKIDKDIISAWSVEKPIKEA